MTDYTKEIHDRAAYCDRVCMNDTARMLREYACLLERDPEWGEIVITTNSTGTECYVVSRQDSEGRILETLWEAPARSEQLSEAYADNVLDPLWKMGGNDGEAYKIALAYARKAFPDHRMQGPGDEPSAEPG